MAQEIGLVAVLDLGNFNSGVSSYLNSINKMNRQTAAFGSGVQAGLGKVGSTLSKVGAVAAAGIATGTLAATAAVGGLTAAIASSTKTAQDFEQAMSQVKAVSQATPEEFAKLTAEAERLGSTTAFTAQQAAEGMNFLAMAGFDATQIVAAMEGVLNTAAAGAVDLGTAADITSNILSGFGKDASEANRIADIMTATFTSANTDITQLGTAMSYVAPQAKDLGLSVEDTATAIGLLSNAGIQGSSAGTGLRQVLIALTKSTGKGADQLKQLGVSIFDSDGQMRSLRDIMLDLNAATANMTDEQRSAALGNIFTARSMAASSVIMGSLNDEVIKTSGGWDGLNEKITESGGIAKDVANTQLDNLAGSITLLGSAFDGLKIKIGNIFLPIFKRFIDFLTNLISKIGPFVEAFFVKVGAAVDTIVGYAEKAINIFGNLFSAFERGSKIDVFKALGFDYKTATKLAKSLDPFLKAVKGLFALFTGNDASGAVSFVDIMVSAFQKGIAFIVERVLPPLTDAINRFVKTGEIPIITDLIEWAKGGVDTDNIVASIANVASVIKDALGVAIEFLTGTVWPLLLTAFNWVTENSDAIIGALIGIGAALIGAEIIAGIAALSAAIAALASPLGILIAVGAALGAAWATNFLGIQDVVGSVVEFIKQNVIPAFSDVVEYISASLPGIITTVTNVFGTIIAVGQEFAKVFADIIIPNISAAFSEITGLLNDLGLDWGDVFGALLKATVAVGAVIATVLGTIVTLTVGFIAGLSGAIRTGIESWRSFINAVYQTFEGLVGIIVGSFAIIKGIFTADTDLILAGLRTWGQGLLNFWGGLWDAVTTLISAPFSIILSFISSFVTAVVSIFSGLYNVLVGNSIIPDMMAAILLSFSTLSKIITEILPGIIKGITALFQNTDWVELSSSAVNAVVDVFEGGFTTIIERGSEFVAAILEDFKLLDKIALPNWIAELPQAFEYIADTVSNLSLSGIIDQFQELSGLQIPEWLQLGSPPPIAQALDYTSAASNAMPDLAAPFIPLDSIGPLADGVYDIGDAMTTAGEDAIGATQKINDFVSSAENASADVNVTLDTGDIVPFNEAIFRIGNYSAASSEELRLLSQSAQELGTNGERSIDEIAAAMLVFAKSGQDAEEVLGNIPTFLSDIAGMTGDVTDLAGKWANQLAVVSGDSIPIRLLPDDREIFDSIASIAATKPLVGVEVRADIDSRQLEHEIENWEQLAAASGNVVEANLAQYLREVAQSGEVITDSFAVLPQEFQNYVQAIIEDGDTLNDWLGQGFAEEARTSLLSIGQVIDEISSGDVAIGLKAELDTQSVDTSLGAVTARLKEIDTALPDVRIEGSEAQDTLYGLSRQFLDLHNEGVAGSYSLTKYLWKVGKSGELANNYLAELPPTMREFIDTAVQGGDITGFLDSVPENARSALEQTATALQEFSGIEPIKAQVQIEQVGGLPPGLQRLEDADQADVLRLGVQVEQVGGLPPQIERLEQADQDTLFLGVGVEQVGTIPPELQTWAEERRNVAVSLEVGAAVVDPETAKILSGESQQVEIQPFVTDFSFSPESGLQQTSIDIPVNAIGTDQVEGLPATFDQVNVAVQTVTTSLTPLISMIEQLSIASEAWGLSFNESLASVPPNVQAISEQLIAVMNQLQSGQNVDTGGGDASTGATTRFTVLSDEELARMQTAIETLNQLVTTTEPIAANQLALDLWQQSLAMLSGETMLAAGESIGQLQTTFTALLPVIDSNTASLDLSNQSLLTLTASTTAYTAAMVEGNPIAAAYTTALGEVGITAKNTGDEIATGMNSAVDAVDKLIGRFNDLIATSSQVEGSIPPSLKPGSPPPLAVGIDYISDAISNMPSFEDAFSVGTGSYISSPVSNSSTSKTVNIEQNNQFPNVDNPDQLAATIKSVTIDVLDELYG